MRIAIIDLGTNSVRFDIHQLGPRNTARVLHREKVMVRLGQGVFTKGRLDQDAIHRTTHAFANFKRVSNEFSVNRIIAIGTSALRDAVDSARFVTHIRKTTGIGIRVISGTEEAKLIALGILSNEKVPKGRVALIDIGGGSTEISIAQKRKIHTCESFPLGTARCHQLFLKKSPPSQETIEELRYYIRSRISKQVGGKKWSKVPEVMGSSGTVKALARISKKSTGKKYLSLAELRFLVKKMSRMTTTQLLGIPGMEAKRVDMILAGAILLQECLEALGAKRILQTDFSLRDGLLREQLELAKKHMTSRIALHLPDLIEKAKKLGADEKHIKAVLKNAEILFQKLRPLHKLSESWKLYLQAAVVLRNTGEAISLVGHAEHSYYIVKNANFPFIEDWESELVGQLCRYHQHQKLDFTMLPFENERLLRPVFLKLLGLMSIVDSLDVIPSSPVIVKRVSLDRGFVKVSFSRGSSSDLEIFRAESRKDLFEKIYRRKFILKRTSG